MTEPEDQGRFLPSRTYSRWRWTVRFGLMTVPFVTLIFGLIELYLTPNQYQSTCVFSIPHGPQPDEIVTLASSRAVVGRVVDRLGLQKTIDCDKETAIGAVIKNLRLEVIPGTQRIELTSEFSNKESARDIAEEIPKSVLQHLSEGLEKDLAMRIGKLAHLIQDATDVADEKSADLAKVQKIHEGSTDESVRQIVDRAKRASILADSEVERLQSLMANEKLSNFSSLPRLDIATAPVIGDHASSPDVAKELGDLFAKSLVFGLIAALALPYLFELAFPPDHGSRALQPALEL